MADIVQMDDGWYITDSCGEVIRGPFELYEDAEEALRMMDIGDIEDEECIEGITNKEEWN